jgi:glycosyltransferase involved in cell wall biosynthesis
VGDAAALSDALYDALTSPEEVKEQARRGRVYIREHFGWETVVEHWEAVYRQLAW